MKQIPLRTTLGKNGMPDLDWRVILEQVIRQPLNQQQGADIEEIRRGVHILDALDAAKGGTLLLEDKDWEHLVEKTKAMHWGVVDRRLIQFTDDILNAQSPPAQEVDGPVSKKDLARA